jgi:hypothetical protein
MMAATPVTRSELKSITGMVMGLASGVVAKP